VIEQYIDVYLNAMGSAKGSDHPLLDKDERDEHQLIACSDAALRCLVESVDAAVKGAVPVANSIISTSQAHQIVPDIDFMPLTTTYSRQAVANDGSA
jgi:hypothetical protein